MFGSELDSISEFPHLGLHRLRLDLDSPQIDNFNLLVLRQKYNQTSDALFGQYIAAKVYIFYCLIDL